MKPCTRLLAMILAAVFTAAGPIQAQRRGDEPAPAGAGAKVLYRADFAREDGMDFAASGYGSAKFLKATMPEVDELARVEGFTVTRAGPPETAFGGKGAMKMLATAMPAKKSPLAERDMVWSADDASVAMLIRPHGVNALFVQAWGKKIGKNLHGEIEIKKQDEWQTVKLRAGGFVGWRGGAVEQGEEFQNLMIALSDLDPAVDKPCLLVGALVVFQGQDAVPPSAPGNVKAAPNTQGGGVRLTWEPATDDVMVVDYEVHRATEADFKPSGKTRIASLHAGQYDDTAAAAGQTFFYRIAAKDAGGSRTPSPAVSATAVAGAMTGGGGAKAEF